MPTAPHNAIRHRALCFVLLCATCFSGITSWSQQAEDRPEDAIVQLQGVWVVTRTVDGGSEQGESSKTHFVFHGQQLWIQEGDSLSPGFFVSLDPSANPTHITLTVGGRVAKGIYEYKNNGLRMCLNVPGQPRPSVFKSDVGTDLRLVELQPEIDPVLSRQLLLRAEQESRAAPRKTPRSVR